MSGAETSSSTSFDGKLFEGIELITAAYTGASKRHDAVAAALRRDVSQLTDECATLRARDSASSAQLAALADRNAALEREQRRLVAENAQLTAQLRHFEARAAKLESFKRAVMSTFEADDGNVANGSSQHLSHRRSAGSSSAVPDTASLSQLLAARQHNARPKPARADESRPLFASQLPHLTPADLDGPRPARLDNDDDDGDGDDADGSAVDDASERAVDAFITLARAQLPLNAFRELLELIEALQLHRLSKLDAIGKARKLCDDQVLRRFVDVVNTLPQRHGKDDSVNDLS